MLTPDPNGGRVDIFDRQIRHALDQAKALQSAGGLNETPKIEAIRADQLNAVKKACSSLNAQERAELARWLTGGASD
jgi:hypothetical protein